MDNPSSDARKGYEIFPPGDYMYDFELPLESNLPETINLKLGSVKYMLEAIVERAGLFSANLVASKAVTLIRTPAQGAMEQVEPIVVNRTMGNEVKLNVMISGKSFPLGAQIPILINITPLSKAQLQWIRVFVTEHIEYSCSNEHVHRVEPSRKLQLFEKRADAPAMTSVPNSFTRTACRENAISYESADASIVGIGGDTDLYGRLNRDFDVGTKMVELLVPLPSCHDVKHQGGTPRLHSDTTYQNILIHHWIKVSYSLKVRAY